MNKILSSLALLLLTTSVAHADRIFCGDLKEVKVRIEDKDLSRSTTLHEEYLDYIFKKGTFYIAASEDGPSMELKKEVNPVFSLMIKSNNPSEADRAQKVIKVLMPEGYKRNYTCFFSKAYDQKTVIVDAVIAKKFDDAYQAALGALRSR